MKRVTTQSGAVYLWKDIEQKVMREGPPAETDVDKPDGGWLDIVEWSRPAVGQPWYVVFPDKRVRVTTPVESVDWVAG